MYVWCQLTYDGNRCPSSYPGHYPLTMIQPSILKAFSSIMPKILDTKRYREEGWVGQRRKGGREGREEGREERKIGKRGKQKPFK